jgi:deazaflavin-dependent oxidoreductase (nitroreductase family)
VGQTVLGFVLPWIVAADQASPFAATLVGMQMPRTMRRINRAFTNRLMRPLAGRLPPLAIVHHVGRKSGRRYRTPVLAFSTADGFVTPLPYGTDTDWCLNWLEAGKGFVEAAGRRTAVANPRIVVADEVLPLLPALLRPGVRLLGLPGFLVVERRARARKQAQDRRSSRVRPSQP